MNIRNLFCFRTNKNLSKQKFYEPFPHRTTPLNIFPHNREWAPSFQISWNACFSTHFVDSLTSLTPTACRGRSLAPPPPITGWCSPKHSPTKPTSPVIVTQTIPRASIGAVWWMRLCCVLQNSRRSAMFFPSLSPYSSSSAGYESSWTQQNANQPSSVSRHPLIRSVVARPSSSFPIVYHSLSRLSSCGYLYSSSASPPPWSL